MTRTIAAVVIVCAVLVGLVYFLLDRSRPKTPPQVEQKIKLKVGYIPIVECAHLYVGLHNDYFAQEQLNVELVSMRGGAVIFPALESRELDIGFGNLVSLITLASKDSETSAPFKSLVGASYERKGHCNHALLMRIDDDIKPAELGEKRIAVNTTKNIEDLMLRRYLEKHGVHQETLNLVEMSFPDMLPALDRKEVDVVSVVEPFIEPALQTKKYRALDYQYLDVADETLVATYAVTREWLSSSGHRDTAEKFVRAFQKADVFIKEHDAEARQIIGRYTRIRSEDLLVIELPAFEPFAKKEPIQVLIDEMVKHKFIEQDKAPKAENLIDNSVKH